MYNFIFLSTNSNTIIIALNVKIEEVAFRSMFIN